MEETFTFTLFAFTSLFTIVNPTGAIPFFNNITEGLSNTKKQQIAAKTASTAFLAMVFFTVSGKMIFDFFNISVDGLRVVGGVLFFINGYDMLQGKMSRTRKPDEEEVDEIDLLAITPLAIPIICGPGTITIANVLFLEAVDIPRRIALFTAIAVVCLLTFLILWGSKNIVRVMGPSGSKVFSRIMGLIIMMIAVEFFFAGIKPYVHSLLSV